MWCSIPEKFQLHVAMLALQFGYAGFHVVSRAALNMGVSKLVFPVYRNIIALLLLLPFAYFLEKKDRPPINLNFLIQFFFLALIGITANQGFYLLGLDNTSPTFASAIQNSVPAITFLMAVILRQVTPYILKIEQVRLNRKDGIAKVAGTIFCVIGATVITLYKAPLLKKYPARLSVTSYTCFFGLLQFLLIALVCERNAQAWIFHSGGEAFTILYAGVVASGIAFAVQIWCIDRGGPVFVAVYQPVQTFVVAIMASLALGEEFYLGGFLIRSSTIYMHTKPNSTRHEEVCLDSYIDCEMTLKIIGAVLIVAGLYFVLWGKNEEKKFAKEQLAIASSTTEHSIIRPSSHAKASLTQPFLSSSTENV
ncbi:auxin-induced protein 5ng4-like [Trifolium pratense]|uniref:WAT1-related protein n=1 Tax=Trifolium pratense TaxID=57577 RepID=A0A2K3N1H8_TRIPR|nr:auxin-induced protein 5ng4-like [Trifolium pratense]